MQPFIVAIDGPAGAGKSTVARELARRLGFVLLDTGAIYRAVALLALERGVALDDDAGLTRLCGDVATSFRFERRETKTHLWLAARDVTVEIRTPEVAQAASVVSARPSVRQALLGVQRALAAAQPTIAEGRDTGTVVFPNADAKFFLDASALERARRRTLEDQATGRETTLKETLAEISRRDARDRGRSVAPLCAAPDAIIVDTSSRTVEEVLHLLESEVRRRMAG